MVALALTFAATLATVSYVEDPEAWDRLPPEIVRQVEDAIVMPNGASELERYDRFYSVEWRGDRPVVVGAFVQRRPEQAEGSNYRLYGPQPFYIEGGGCGVVNLSYDLEESASPDLNCNPETGAEPRAKLRRFKRAEPQVVEVPRR
jgi:hypothetical protein